MIRHAREKCGHVCAVLALVWLMPWAAAASDDGAVWTLVASNDWAGLRAQGPSVLPALVRLYENSGEDQRASIALAFYQLSWKSPEAKAALMRDVHTTNQTLRLQVQWALGRVSADEDVVQTLLANMRDDPSPLFRDKAACALSYDQIHLTPHQKIKLFEGLVAALDDEKPDVRNIAFLSMQIHTGQTRGYSASAPPAARAAAVESWKKWLDEYRSQY